jgi:lysophospholipase L1-like esterase
MRSSLSILGALLIPASTWATTTFGLDNASLLAALDPLVWDVSGTAHATTITQGAQIALNFTGTSFTLENSGIDATNPVLSYQVDGGAITQTVIGSSMSMASGLADTNHTIKITLRTCNLSDDGEPFAGSRGWRVTGVTVDTGKTISASPPTNGTMLFYGDSITSGYGGESTGNMSNWPRVVANTLNAKCAMVGFNGQGYQAGPPYVPVAIDTFAFLTDGVARNFEAQPPTWVFVAFGANGSTTAQNVQDYLEAVRAEVGPDAWLIQMIPFSQFVASTITTGYNNYQTANSDAKAMLMDLGAAGSAIMADTDLVPDGTHPAETGSAALAELIALEVPELPGGASTITTLNVSGILNITGP